MVIMNQRCEPRLEADQSVWITLFGEPDIRLPARVKNVSTRGLGLELEALQRDYRPDSLWFVDDVFTISHKWLTSFRDELRKHNLLIPYECITRADRLNEEVILMLKETGCFRVQTTQKLWR